MRVFRHLDSLPYFMAAAEHRGVRRAATTLAITQPALTRRIQLLEEELGTRLMERSEKGVALTTSGEILARAARQIERVCQQAQAEILEATSGSLTELRVGAGPAWSYDLVPRAIGQLRALHPNLNVHLQTGRIDLLLEQLKQGELDVLIATLPAEGEAIDVLTYVFLCEISVSIFSSVNHPLVGRENLGPQDLGKYPWIWMEGTGVGKQHVAAYFNRGGCVLPPATVTTNSFQSGISLLSTGPYLMMLPSTVTQLVSGRDLHPLSIDGSIWTYPAGVICRVEVSGLRTFKSFVNCMRQVVAGTSGWRT